MTVNKAWHLAESKQMRQKGYDWLPVGPAGPTVPETGSPSSRFLRAAIQRPVPGCDSLTLYMYQWHGKRMMFKTRSSGFQTNPSSDVITKRSVWAVWAFIIHERVRGSAHVSPSRGQMNINITVSPSLLTFVSEGILPLDHSQTYINILTGIMRRTPGGIRFLPSFSWQHEEDWSHPLSHSGETALAWRCFNQLALKAGNESMQLMRVCWKIKWALK